jgi:hypothetical protein
MKNEGFLFGLVVGTLIMAFFATWVRDRGRDECEEKLPRSEKCVPIWMPEKQKEAGNAD